MSENAPEHDKAFRGRLLVDEIGTLNSSDGPIQSEASCLTGVRRVGRRWFWLKSRTAKKLSTRGSKRTSPTLQITLVLYIISMLNGSSEKI